MKINNDKISFFDTLVPSYFETDYLQILILQNNEGDLITIKIDELYEE